VSALTDSALHDTIGAGGSVPRTGDTLHGRWDRIAMAPASCCTLDMLHGDAHVRLDWAGTRLTPITAGALLNLAVPRVGDPLVANDSAGLAAAQQRWGSHGARQCARRVQSGVPGRHTDNHRITASDGYEVTKGPLLVFGAT
jgi:hypothetical protein